MSMHLDRLPQFAGISADLLHPLNVLSVSWAVLFRTLRTLSPDSLLIRKGRHHHHHSRHEHFTHYNNENYKFDKNMKKSKLSNELSAEYGNYINDDDDSNYNYNYNDVITKQNDVYTSQDESESWYGTQAEQNDDGDDNERQPQERNYNERSKVSLQQTREVADQESPKDELQGSNNITLRKNNGDESATYQEVNQSISKKHNRHHRSSSSNSSSSNHNKKNSNTSNDGNHANVSNASGESSNPSLHRSSKEHKQNRIVNDEDSKQVSMRAESSSLTVATITTSTSASEVATTLLKSVTPPLTPTLETHSAVLTNQRNKLLGAHLTKRSHSAEDALHAARRVSLRERRRHKSANHSHHRSHSASSAGLSTSSVHEVSSSSTTSSSFANATLPLLLVNNTALDNASKVTDSNKRERLTKRKEPLFTKDHNIIAEENQNFNYEQQNHHHHYRHKHHLVDVNESTGNKLPENKQMDENKENRESLFHSNTSTSSVNETINTNTNTNTTTPTIITETERESVPSDKLASLTEHNNTTAAAAADMIAANEEEKGHTMKSFPLGKPPLSGRSRASLTITNSHTDVEDTENLIRGTTLSAPPPLSVLHEEDSKLFSQAASTKSTTPLRSSRSLRLLVRSPRHRSLNASDSVNAEEDYDSHDAATRSKHKNSHSARSYVSNRSNDSSFHHHHHHYNHRNSNDGNEQEPRSLQKKTTYINANEARQFKENENNNNGSNNRKKKKMMKDQQPSTFAEFMHRDMREEAKLISHILRAAPVSMLHFVCNIQRQIAALPLLVFDDLSPRLLRNNRNFNTSNQGSAEMEHSSAPFSSRFSALKQHNTLEEAKGNAVRPETASLLEQFLQWTGDNITTINQSHNDTFSSNNNNNKNSSSSSNAIYSESFSEMQQGNSVERYDMIDIDGTNEPKIITASSTFVIHFLLLRVILQLLCNYAEKTFFLDDSLAVRQLRSRSFGRRCAGWMLRITSHSLLDPLFLSVVTPIVCLANVDTSGNSNSNNSDIDTINNNSKMKGIAPNLFISIPGVLHALVNGSASVLLQYLITPLVTNLFNRACVTMCEGFEYWFMRRYTVWPSDDDSQSETEESENDENDEVNSMLSRTTTQMRNNNNDNNHNNNYNYYSDVNSNKHESNKLNKSNEFSEEQQKQKNQEIVNSLNKIKRQVKSELENTSNTALRESRHEQKGVHSDYNAKSSEHNEAFVPTSQSITDKFIVSKEKRAQRIQMKLERKRQRAARQAAADAAAHACILRAIFYRVGSSLLAQCVIEHPLSVLGEVIKGRAMMHLTGMLISYDALPRNVIKVGWHSLVVYTSLLLKRAESLMTPEDVSEKRVLPYLAALMTICGAAISKEMLMLFSCIKKNSGQEEKIASLRANNKQSTSQSSLIASIELIARSMLSYIPLYNAVEYTVIDKSVSFYMAVYTRLRRQVSEVTEVPIHLDH